MLFIHRRFSWFSRSDSPYLRALRKAHKVHHKRLGREDGECFGMLLVPFKYYREASRSAQRGDRDGDHNEQPRVDRGSIEPTGRRS